MSRASRDLIGRGIAGGITGALQIYSDRKKEEEALRTAEDPNASDMQKAIALSKLSPELGNQYLKQSAVKQLTENLSQKYPLAFGQPGFTPNAPSMASRNATIPNAQIPEPMSVPGGTQIGSSGGANNQQLPQPQPNIPVDTRQQEQQLGQAATELASVNPAIAAQLANQAKMLQKDRIAKENAERNARQQVEFQERKANEAYRQHILSGIPQSKKLDAQLGRIEKLSAKAETTPAAVKALNFFGIPIGAFDTANAQELEKISNDLTATIQSDYGNRILETEFNTFLKRIPTLLNSEEGRARIIRNMRLYNDAAQAEQKAYLDIYRMQKQSGIQHPIVRQEDVLEMSEPALNVIFDKLNSELIEDSGTKEAAKLLPPAAQGTARMVKDGKFYDFPADQLQLRKKQGFAPL